MINEASNSYLDSPFANLIPAVVVYLVASYLMARLFKNTGVPSWKGWIPVYQIASLLKLGRQPAWVSYPPFLIAILLYIPYLGVQGNQIDALNIGYIVSVFLLTGLWVVASLLLAVFLLLGGLKLTKGYGQESYLVFILCVSVILWPGFLVWLGYMAFAQLPPYREEGYKQVAELPPGFYDSKN